MHLTPAAVMVKQMFVAGLTGVTPANLIEEHFFIFGSSRIVDLFAMIYNHTFQWHPDGFPFQFGSS